MSGRRETAAHAHPIQRIPNDLAPGDQRAIEFDWKDLRILPIRDPSDPEFEPAYRFLWDEFGPKHEVEQKQVLVERLARDPAAVIGGFSFLYEMIAVRDSHGLAAVRDHTAIVPREDAAAPITVHLSHLLIAPRWRGTGLTAWMRAWPIQTARRASAIAGEARLRPITLVAEMEHPDPNQPDTLVRLKSYQKAGFLKIDPAAVDYHQPDFRPFDQIDATGGPRPLAFALILRRVGREAERLISFDELRSTVLALYTMYGLEFRAQDMQPMFAELEPYPRDEVRLVEPLAIR